MRASSDSAVIINISSVSGMRPNPFGVAYGAAKAGIINATQTLALEWGPEIRVVSISAGLVLTEESRSFYGDDSTVEKLLRQYHWVAWAHRKMLQTLVFS